VAGGVAQIEQAGVDLLLRRRRDDVRHIGDPARWGGFRDVGDRDTGGENERGDHE